jgi:hypothetical protein
MPASISHEGYSAKPMHSYWDDFWALRGYKDAVEIAQWLGHDEDAKRFAASRDQFRDDLYASLKIAMAQKQITFIPGSAELGDFDATSTTIALAPAASSNTSRRTRSSRRSNATGASSSSAPKASARGRTTRRTSSAPSARSCASVGRTARTPRSISSSTTSSRAPGTSGRKWSRIHRANRSSSAIFPTPGSLRTTCVRRSTCSPYERGDQIVLAAGIPEPWLEGEGIAIDGLRTPGGPLAYSLRANTTTVRLAISRGTPPPGGFVFTWKGKETRVTRVPATVELPRQ